MKNLRCHLKSFCILLFTSVLVLTALEALAFERTLQKQVRQGDWNAANIILQRAEQRCQNQ